MKKINKQWVSMLIVFMMAFIPRAVFSFMYGSPFSVPRDEMSTIAASAMSAGYDWSNVAIGGKCYYGAGYTIFFTPLFRMGMNPYRIYDIMLLVSCGLQAIGAPVCYYIMKKYFNITKEGVLVWTSVAASYLVAIRAMMIFNEHMLIAVSWLIALTLCKLIEHNADYKKKSIHTILLMMELSYILTCHTRVKTYWYALIVLVFLFYFVYKKWLVAVIPAVISGAIGYTLAQKFIEYVKVLVWHWEEGMKLKNSYVQINLSPEVFTKATAWQGIFSTILGQFNSMFAFSAGIFTVVIVVLVCLWYKKLKNVVLERYCHKEVVLNEITGEKVILMLAAFFGMCIVATTLAQSITWLDKVMKAFDGGSTYGYKAFSYIRYNGIYYGPFFMAGFSCLYQCRDKIKSYLKSAILMFTLVFFGWLVFIFPYSCNVEVASRVYRPFAYLWYLLKGKDYSEGLYLTAIVAIISLFAILVALLWKRKFKLCSMLFVVVLIYEYVVAGILIDAPRAANYVKKASATYEIFQQAEELEGADILPENLYIAINEGGTMQRTYTYQFLLYDYKIIWEMPTAEMTEAIVLSDKKDREELFEMGYVRCKLDKNEFLYIKGDSLIALFESLGCTFYSFRE